MKESPLRREQRTFIVTIATLLLISLSRSQKNVPGALITKFRNNIRNSKVNQTILIMIAFEGNTPTDGIRWNLNDERGRLVGSGTYIFFATQLNDNNGDVQTKKGKFAVLR